MRYEIWPMRTPYCADMETVMGLKESDKCPICGHSEQPRRPFPWKKALGVMLVTTGTISGLLLAITPVTALTVYVNYPIFHEPTNTQGPSAFGFVVFIQAVIFLVGAAGSFIGAFANDLFKD